MPRPLDLSWQLFYEDIPVGYQGTGLSRTIQLADIIGYANYTRDYQQIHTDRQFARSSLYGDVILHGLAGVAFASGMLLRTEFGTRTVRTMLTCLGFRTIKFPLPIMVDDTITLHFEVVGKSDHDETKGLVEMRLDTTNQRDETVSTHTRTYLFAKKSFDFETIAERGAF